MTPARLSLVLLALSHDALGASPPAPPPCPEQQRIELSRPAVPGAREICLHPGVLTALLFDEPVSVDLQDEVRFAQILRSDRGLGLVPPRDMTPGERLRLTVRFPPAASPSSITFALVFRPGQQTRQVDVFRDDRSRDVLVRQLDEEHARSQRLRVENQALREQLQQPLTLRRLFLGGALAPLRIRNQNLLGVTLTPPEALLTVISGLSYRQNQQVAVEVRLRNEGPASWTLSAMSLTGSQGEPLEDVDFVRPGPLEPQLTQRLFVEGTLPHDSSLRTVSVSLEDTGGHRLTLPPIALP